MPSSISPVLFTSSWSEEFVTWSQADLTSERQGDYVQDDGGDNEDLPLHSNLFLNVVYLIVLVVTTVVGNIGNVMVIGAVLTDRRLRKEGNIFILNLAFADLCVTSFVDPSSIAGVFVGPDFWRQYNGLCHVIGSVCSVSCVCSLWSIAAISLNRYILLCRQHVYRRVYTLRNTVCMCLGLWLATIMLDLPNFLDWGDHTYDMKTMACSYDRTASYSYTVFFITMFVTIPLVTVLFCNLNIYIVVLKSKMRVATHRPAPGSLAWADDQTSTAYVYIDGETAGGTCKPGELIAVQRPYPNQLQVPKEQNGKTKRKARKTTTTTLGTDGETRMAGMQSAAVNSLPDPEINLKTSSSPSPFVKSTISENSKSRGRNMKSEIRLAKTLFIIFIVFVVCWAPYALICLIDRYDRISKETYTVSILFAHSSSTLNSVLYAATNKGFREGYKVFLNKCGCKIS